MQGIDFKVITDHKPLVGTFKKVLGDIDNAHLVRFREKLAHFSFSVSYAEGKTHLIADALSRVPVFDPPEEEAISVNTTLVLSLASDPMMEPLTDAAASDQNYLSVIDAIL